MKISVVFGEHIDVERINGMLGTFQAAGDVKKLADNRSFVVIVRRPSGAGVTYLHNTLRAWELRGFLTYTIE